MSIAGGILCADDARIKKLQAENKRLKTLGRKIVLCFPEIIPDNQEEISFNIPAYIIEELKQALKG